MLKSPVIGHVTRRSVWNFTSVHQHSFSVFKTATVLLTDLKDYCIGAVLLFVDVLFT